jgi:hypothetical protein
MPEIKGSNLVDFMPSVVDPEAGEFAMSVAALSGRNQLSDRFAVRFKDKAREKQRQAVLRQRRLQAQAGVAQPDRRRQQATLVRCVCTELEWY